jgi:antitoxin YefM
MTETQHLISTKSNRKRLAESIEQVEKGDFKSFDLDKEQLQKGNLFI